MKLLLTIVIIGTIFLGGACWGAELFPGYAGSPWETDIAAIIKAYPKGTLGKLNNQIIYKQAQPNRELRQRSFAFRENKLVAVTLSFSPEFVSKTGIEHLLAIHQKNFGPAQVDRTNAPHLLAYIWDNGKTKVTFAYMPGKLEYTVLMFQQK